MNSASRMYMKESFAPSWHKIYDPDIDSTYYHNEETKQNSWIPPKKIKHSADTYIPIEKFISVDTSSQNEPLYLSHLVSLPSTLNLNSRCHRCDGEYDVRKHGYCGDCFTKINSPQEPEIGHYRIKCLGCHGWGLNLIGDDGFCGHCRRQLDNEQEIKAYDNQEEINPMFLESSVVKCRGCGGWGKDLVKENGKCNHCTREEAKQAFEAKWKTKCKTCGGWGLELVKEDGLCNHCRRQFEDERIFFSRVLEQKPPVKVETRGEGINLQAIYSSILGKRAKDPDDFDF